MAKEAKDPFGSATDTVEPKAPSVPDADPFGQPTQGAWPKVPELLGKLLVLKPVSMDRVQKPNSTELQDRWKVDTWVFNDDGTVTKYAEMYWSQISVAKAMTTAVENGKPILGTLHLVPVKATKKQFDTEDALLGWEEIQRWLARNGVGTPPTPVAWVLNPATDEESAKAIAYWNSRN